MNKLLAKAPRLTSNSDAAGSVSAAPAMLARIARVVVVPMVAVAALVGAAGSAHAATNSVGNISITVSCITDLVRHTSQIEVDPSAIENSRVSNQWVAYRYGYYAGQSFVASTWSGPTLVDAVQVKADAYGNTITVTNPTPLPSARWNVAFGGGRIPVMYVQGGFWNGTAYEYGPWSQAVNYIAVNNYGNGQGPVPCSV
jgi:hypothetical protein